MTTPTTTTMGDSLPSRRDRRNAIMARLLLATSKSFLVLSIILIGVLLSAGTFVVPFSHLGFKSLAMVSFDGIVPFSKSNTTRSRHRGPPGQDFYVTLHRFPNAFSWECMQCPPVKYDARGFPLYAGVVQAGALADMFYPMPAMLQVAEEIGAPGVSKCFDPNVSEQDKPHMCSQPGVMSGFFGAWANSTRGRLRAGLDDSRASAMGKLPLGFIVYIAAVAVAAMVLVNEGLIAYAPWHMRCRCLCMRRWCPYPDATKLSRDEIENLPEHRWDRIRLATYGLALAYFVLPAFHDTVFPALYVLSLRFVDGFYVAKADFGRGKEMKGLSMHPRQSRAYLLVLWAPVVLSALALAAVYFRWRITRPSGRHITLDDLVALENPSSFSGEEAGVKVSSAEPTKFAVGDDAEDIEDMDDDVSESKGLLQQPSLV